MANPLLRRLLGEAAFAAGPEGKGRYSHGGKEEEVPSYELDTSDMAKAVGASAETDMSNPEEKREVQIAREILSIAKNLAGDSHGAYSTSAPAARNLEALADELISMHGQSPA